jgi:hypothetical protein
MNFLCKFGILCTHLIYFMAILYILWTFLYYHHFDIFYQEKSGNPGLDRKELCVALSNMTGSHRQHNNHTFISLIPGSWCNKRCRPLRSSSPSSKYLDSSRCRYHKWRHIWHLCRRGREVPWDRANIPKQTEADGKKTQSWKEKMLLIVIFRESHICIQKCLVNFLWMIYDLLFWNRLHIYKN